MLKRLLNKSDFLKNSLVLITGTALAQLVPILLQLILRRIYGDSDFGLFAIYGSVFGMIIVFASLRYETTIIIPKKDEDAAQLLVGSIMISFIFCLLLFITTFFLSEWVIKIFDFPPLIKNWLYFIPVSVFLVSSYSSINNWFIRKKRFKASSLNKIIRRSGEGITQLGTGWKGIYGGLIIGNIIGDFINFMIGIYQLTRNSFPSQSINWEGIKKQLVKYKEFPIYSAIPAVLNSISLFLPVIIVNKLYSVELTGQYDLSRQMLTLPLALISITVSQVLIQKVAESKNNDQSIMKLILRIAAILLVISIIGIVIIHFFSIEIFTFAFGDKWVFSGEIAKILVYAYAIKFVVSPLSAIFTALEKIKISSVWQVMYFCSICSLFWFTELTIQKFLVYYMIIDICAYSVYFILIYVVSNNYDKKLI